MVIVLATYEKLHICIDPTNLNKAIRKVHNPLKTIEDVIQQNSSKKCEFRKIHVTNVGRVLTPEGIQPDNACSVRDACSAEWFGNLTFLGFIQYLGKFLSNLSEVSSPLRTLLEKDVYFHCDTPQEKSSICKSVLLVTHLSCITLTWKKSHLPWL